MGEAKLFRRDMDLVRDILLWAEKGGLPRDSPEAAELALCYHVKIMVDAGLIDGKGEYRKDVATGTWKPGIYIVKAPSWQGQEFLALLRKDTVWNLVKEKAAEHGLPFFFEMAKKIAVRLAADAGLTPEQT